MQQSIDSDNGNLSVYIAYDDFLSADQLIGILASLDQLYTALYIANVPDIQLPLPQETRMRIRESRTGNSILLELAEGIRQVWDETTIQISKATDVMVNMSAILISYARGFLEFRRVWSRGGQVRHEPERLHRQVPTDEFLDLSSIPVETKQQIHESAIRFLTLAEYSPNITRVKVNQITLLEKTTSNIE